MIDLRLMSENRAGLREIKKLSSGKAESVRHLQMSEKRTRYEAVRHFCQNSSLIG